MREATEYYYDTKYDSHSTPEEKRLARHEMIATYTTVRDLGLITREEYLAEKARIREAERAYYNL